MKNVVKRMAGIGTAYASSVTLMPEGESEGAARVPHPELVTQIDRVPGGVIISVR